MNASVTCLNRAFVAMPEAIKERFPQSKKIIFSDIFMTS